MYTPPTLRIMSSSSTGLNPLGELDGISTTWAIASATNGEHFVSGSTQGVRVWQAAVDGKQIATITMGNVVINCLAVSKDETRIAAGTFHGEVWVWDAKTYKQVFVRWQDSSSDGINAVDFSPDSTRLAVASNFRGGAVIIYDTSPASTGCNSIGSLEIPQLPSHGGVRGAKYSPQGDRIAIASFRSVQVYDSNGGHLLVDVPITVVPWYNTGLVWSDDSLLVVSDNNIKHINASTGSAISEWPVSDTDTNHCSCIVLPQHGEFVACSAKRTVTFWNTSTHTQLGQIQHAQDIRSIALSPDGRFIAIGGESREISIKYLSGITEPDILIDDAALHSWKHGELANAEVLLTTAISTSQNTSHHVLSSRALVRARLGKWDEAIDDAHKSIEIRPSITGYIAKSIALVGKGGKHKGYRACDTAFEHVHPTHVRFLLLIKAIIIFMAGEHSDAISRIDDLIDTVPFSSTCYVVQAYMYLLLGISHMESNNYQSAIHSFECARAQIQHYTSRSLLAVSLISGWNFDGLGITIQWRISETLFAAGRTNDGAQSLLEMVTTFGEELYTNESMTKWVSDFAHRCLSASENNGNTATEIITPLVREWTKATLASGSWKGALAASVTFSVPKFTICRVICERLVTMDRVTDAVECWQQMASELGNGQDMQGKRAKWVLDFKRNCGERLRRLGDEAVDDQRYDDAVTHYSVVLSLDPSAPQDIHTLRSKAYALMGSWEYAIDDATRVLALDPSSPWCYETMLMEWAKVKLMDGTQWMYVLSTASGLKVPRFDVYRVVCEHLEMTNRIAEATECFHQMENELGQSIQGNEAKWIFDFKYRCCGRLEDLGDTAMNTLQYHEAISHYSAALSLSPTTPQALFDKRSKACAARSLWQDALNDANEAIMLDPSSPFGYERKYVALRGARQHKDMLDAFELMFLKMSNSIDPEICKRYRMYTETRGVIRRAIWDAIRESPRVLINTTSGRLCNKSEQATAFELSPIFTELLLSMTTHVDHARIEQEVKNYYRYATFSHKWEVDEPLFDKVLSIVVYDLEESPTHDKLQMFCKIVWGAGFHWAWSDTCCINKADHLVLQEALVAMFKWYEGSALTIIFLRGVSSLSRRGALVKSVWNTRAWTFQEYHASKVVRFYTEDWTPYLNLNIPNHKESPEIISEMEEATGTSKQLLMGLRPGLNDIRDKLCLASQRETTLAEDAAYSLLGIFSVSLPVVYGEGDRSLGRLLAQLLESSGDTSILAWTGTSGSFNSCLPTSIRVFSQRPTTHIPPVLTQAETDAVSAGLQTPPVDLRLTMQLYDRLHALHVPSFGGRRMKLPCITFKLGPLFALPRTGGSEYVFRAQTTALGIIEIRTKDNLSRLRSLYLVHPWIDFLLDRQPVRSLLETIYEESAGELPSFSGPSHIPSAVPQAQATPFFTNSGQSFTGQTGHWDAPPLRPPSTVLPMDKEMRALRLLFRLTQPFSALLLTPDLGNVAAYSRVAADSLITVQVQGITPMILNTLVESVRVLDVL